MRDLDEAVARVLGAKQNPANWWEWPFPVPFKTDDWDTGGLPPFSTDWNWAMWAAEKAGLRGSATDFEVAWDGENYTWSASVFLSKSGPVERLAFAEAPTGPEAICRAILKLKGVEVPA